jgi:ferredoxin-NADP reductase
MAGAAILGRPLMWHVGTVVALRDETATARTITLQVPDWPGHFAGQHLEVRLTAPDGYSAVRSYSIASAPNSEGRVQITVERVPNGEVSPYLTQEVVVGDRLELRGPYGGWFVWRSEQTGPVQLIAGGSGIVPLMAMIRTRFSSGGKSQFRLLYSAREVESIFYRDELKALSEDKLGLNVTYVYTRKIPMGWPRPAGRIDANLVANTTWPAVLDPTSYICGPTSFVEAAADLLLATAMKRDNIRTERFGPTGERR